MTNINISLTEEAYNYLKMLKGRDKSFSEVIIEIKENCEDKKGSKERIMKFFGALKDSDMEELGKRVKKIREDLNEELDERLKERLK